jgi:hypothetical protein
MTIILKPSRLYNKNRLLNPIYNALGLPEMLRNAGYLITYAKSDAGCLCEVSKDTEKDTYLYFIDSASDEPKFENCRTQITRYLESEKPTETFVYDMLRNEIVIINKVIVDYASWEYYIEKDTTKSLTKVFVFNDYTAQGCVVFLRSEAFGCLVLWNHTRELFAPKNNKVSESSFGMFNKLMEDYWNIAEVTYFNGSAKELTGIGAVKTESSIGAESLVKFRKLQANKEFPIIPANEAEQLPLIEKPGKNYVPLYAPHQFNLAKFTATEQTPTLVYTLELSRQAELNELLLSLYIENGILYAIPKTAAISTEAVFKAVEKTLKELPEDRLVGLTFIRTNI